MPLFSRAISKEFTIKEYERILLQPDRIEHKLFMILNELPDEGIGPDIFSFLMRHLKAYWKIGEIYNKDGVSKKDQIELFKEDEVGSKAFIPTLLVVRKLTKSPRYDFGVLLRNIDATDVKFLINSFQSKNEYVSTLSYDIVENIYCQFSEIITCIQEIVENEFVDFFNGYRNSNGIKLLLKLSQGFATDNDLPDTDIFFANYILPCIFMRNCDNKYENSIVLHTFCENDSRCIKLAADYFCKQFSRIDTQMRMDMFDYMKELILLQNSDEIIPQICDIASQAFQSENHLIVKEALNFFCFDNERFCFKASMPKILPNIFPSLYKNSKTLWHTEQRLRMLKWLYNAYFYNIQLFNFCLKSYDSICNKLFSGADMKNHYRLFRCISGDQLSKNEISLHPLQQNIVFATISSSESLQTAEKDDDVPIDNANKVDLCSLSENCGSCWKIVNAKAIILVSITGFKDICFKNLCYTDDFNLDSPADISQLSARSIESELKFYELFFETNERNTIYSNTYRTN